MLGSRQRSQSVVEFGLVAILFTLLMFAVVDFGLLLNSWIALSSGTRQLARNATVGYLKDDLSAMVTSLALPGISRQAYAPFVKYCCGEGGSLSSGDSGTGRGSLSNASAMARTSPRTPSPVAAEMA